MAFWDQGFYFERDGDRYVYRPTALSRGYEVSAQEKDRLFRGLKRLQWRLLGEGFLAIALIAGLFLTGLLESETPIHWFILLSVLAVTAQAAISMWRTKKLIVRILGNRTPDVPRLPFKKAIATPRPLVSKRYAIPVLQSTVVLMSLFLIAGDAFVLYLVVAAYRADLLAAGTDAAAAAGPLLDATLYSFYFWAGVALFNALLLACIAWMSHEIRRLRQLPSIAPTDKGE